MKRIRVSRVERTGNSRDGNPTWKVVTDDGQTYRTRPNTGDAYKITGNEAAREVDIITDGQLQIIGWDPV